MLTNIKRENLEEVILGNHELYNVFSLIGDKLRVIYTALGWTHMTKNFSEADNVVEELTNNVIERLNTLEDREQEPPQETSFATAGLEVSGYWDEEGCLNLDYSFNLA